MPNRDDANVNSRALLASTVAELRAIPDRLSGDDSLLADPWEEIKGQVQEELSPYWPAYLDTIKQFINGQLRRSPRAKLLALSSELKVPAEHKSQISRLLLQRLLAKTKRERVRYVPFDYEYMPHSVEGISIYAQIIERTGMNTCKVLAEGIRGRPRARPLVRLAPSWKPNISA
jgi:hypothetical protein